MKIGEMPLKNKLNTKMSAQEMAETNSKVNAVNNQKNVSINKMGDKKGHLGKDSFLKLLVTQLKHQDPTKPMEDKEFIAQMAQFSSLEQMSNINKEMKSLIKSSKSSEAINLLGKYIDAFNPINSERTSGIVSSVRFNEDEATLIVDNKEVSMNTIHKVHNINEKKQDKDLVLTK